MSYTSMFFNSTDIADNGYGASEFANYFRTIIGDGVFPDRDRTGLSVSVVPGTMNVTILPGAVFIKGHMCILDEPEVLSLGTSPVFNRTDYIVMRLDNTRDVHGYRRAGSVYPFLLTGTPGGDPPALSRDNNIWDMLLCEVTVNGNTANLNGAALVDRRPDPAVCGFVSFLGEALEVKTGPAEEMPSPMSRGMFWLTPDGKLYVSDGARNIWINNPYVKSVNSKPPDASGNVDLGLTAGDITPFFGTATAAAEMAAAIPGFKPEHLISGIKIIIRISGALPANAKLNINEIGAYPIYWNSTTIKAGALPSGTHYYEMIFDSNRWHILTLEGDAASAAYYSSAIVTGTYTGNGDDSQTIQIGFRPRAVIVVPQGSGFACDIQDVVGGLATQNGNQFAGAYDAIKLTSTGFTVYRKNQFQDNGTILRGIFPKTNLSGTYNYIAFR